MTRPPLNVLLVDFGAEQVIIIVQEALDEVHKALRNRHILWVIGLHGSSVFSI